MGDDLVDIEMAASKFKGLAAELNTADDDVHYIIDIGASNAKAMIEHFANLRTTRAAIDYWVIPVVPSKKQQADSLNTLQALGQIGVDYKKIVMVLNNIDDERNLTEEFSNIFKVRALDVHVTEPAVLSSEIFELLKDKVESVFAMVASQPDFKMLIKQARDNKDTERLKVLGMNQVLHDLAESSVENLISVFNATPIGMQLAADLKNSNKLSKLETKVKADTALELL